MKREEQLMIGGSLLLAIIIMEAIVYGGLGLGVLLGVVAYFVCTFIFARVYGKKMNLAAKWLLVPIVLCTLCFVLFSNGILRFFNIIFLLGLLLIHGLEFFNTSEKEIFLSGWFRDVISFGITLPFVYMNKPYEITKGELSTGNKENVKVIGKVVIGLIIGLPVLIIVTGLLASSDAAFEGVLDAVFRSMSFDVDQIWGKILVVVILFFMLFSYFYGLSHKEDKTERVMKASRLEMHKPIDELLYETEKEDNKENKEVAKESNDEVYQQERLSASSTPFHFDFIIISTIASLLCFIYLVFCFSQLAYFVSAFSGILPTEFTFAEYARRGFFETVPLAGFNLMVIIILGIVMQAEAGKKKAYVKGMISFVIGFTLFLVICALSKMVMYVQEYGLSLLRVYVAWFLCLGIIVILLVAIKIFLGKLKITKSLFILFSVMYLGLNYANVDYLVAAQNVSLYKQNKVDDLSGCYNLSTSALGPIQELAMSHPELFEEKAAEDRDQVANVIGRLEYEIQNKNWQSWNVADYFAAQKIQALKATGYKTPENDYITRLRMNRY